MDYVKLTTQGAVQTPVSISGYPATVGNVLTSTVSSLTPNTTYYYTVSPQGNSAAVSNQIQLTTALDDGVTGTSNYILRWIVISDGIILRDLPANAHISLYNLMGKKIISEKPMNNETHIKLDSHGIYLLQIQKDRELISCKVKY